MSADTAGAAFLARRIEPPGRSLDRVAVVLFWGYIATVVFAGLWGVVGARLDFPILLQQKVSGLSPSGAADVLSQYRFLRGIEGAFGIMCIWMRSDIFTPGSPWNRMFLVGMCLGLAGRIFGWVLDGTPTWPMFLFLGFELVAVFCIAIDTRSPRVAARPPS